MPMFLNPVYVCLQCSVALSLMILSLSAAEVPRYFCVTFPFRVWVFFPTF